MFINDLHDISRDAIGHLHTLGVVEVVLIVKVESRDGTQRLVGHSVFKEELGLAKESLVVAICLWYGQIKLQSSPILVSFLYFSEEYSKASSKRITKIFQNFCILEKWPF